VKVHDIHYDHGFSNLGRDGGEVYFGTDVSTHPEYCNYMVKTKNGAASERSVNNWRELDQRYWSESKSNWLKRSAMSVKFNERRIRRLINNRETMRIELF
jgi:hypothetical protein